MLAFEEHAEWLVVVLSSRLASGSGVGVEICAYIRVVVGAMDTREMYLVVSYNAVASSAFTGGFHRAFPLDATS